MDETYEAATGRNACIPPRWALHGCARSRVGSSMSRRSEGAVRSAGRCGTGNRVLRGGGEGSMRKGQRDQGPSRMVVDRVFPRSCSLCGEVGSHEDPCPDCVRSLDGLLRGTACPRCAAPLMVTTGEVPPTAGPALTPCVACLSHPPPFDRVVAPWSFTPPLSGLIHRMKYRRDLAAAAALGRLLAREVKARPGATPPPGAVIGVPLSRRRLLYRGFNHAAELAAIVRRALGLRTIRGVRIARRHTPAPGEGRERGGAPRERRRRVHRSPMAGGPPRGRDRGRRPDDRRHRVGAGPRSPGPGRGADRGVVLRAYTPFLSSRRAPSSPVPRPRP